MNRKRDIDFQYYFVPMGSVVSEAGEDPILRPLRNRIFLDVGNGLRSGVIDQHHLTKGIEGEGRIYKSASGILSQCPHFVHDNVDDDAQVVEIILHKFPDFDCYAAAYLARELIITGSLPANYCSLVEYVEEVDSGAVKINPNQMRTPAAVACAIPPVLDTKPQDLDINMLRRGMELIEYLMARMDEVHGTLYSPALFPEKNPFVHELDFVRDDYQKYRNDTADEGGICEKHSIRLPVINSGMEQLEEVDALFWNRKPSCILHKYWAREDEASPSETGYICTFIPVDPMVPFDIEPSAEKGVDTARVIISVDPESSVCLKGLAVYLERAEMRKEEEIFKDAPQRMRNRNIRRFRDEWCMNGDPWYDGRNSDYTIVDSPGRGSLLTIVEIRDIVLNFTKPRIIKSFARFILPFYFDQDRYNKLYSILNAMDDMEALLTGEDDYFSEGRVGFFLPYIQRYLFNRNTKRYTALNKTGGFKRLAGRFPSQESLPYSAHYRLKGILGQEMGKVIEDEEVIQTEGDPVKWSIKDIRASVFKYGTGFLIADVQMEEPSELLFDHMLSFNSRVCSRCGDINNFFFSALSPNREFSFAEGGCQIHTAVEVSPQSFYISEKREMLYKLCSIMEWDEPFSQDGYVNSLMDRMFLEAGDYGFYGFSKSGGALIMVGDRYRRDNVKKKMNALLESFRTTDFDIFLLALQQRNSLMVFSNRLSEYEKLRKWGKIGRLRSNLVNFITQGWFSQITSNEIGMEMYRRWTDILETKVLYDEVSEQMSGVDDYNEAKFSKEFGRISAFVFPLLFITSLIDVGIINIEPLTTLASRWWALIIVLSAVGLALLMKYVKRY